MFHRISRYLMLLLLCLPCSSPRHLHGQEPTGKKLVSTISTAMTDFLMKAREVETSRYGNVSFSMTETRNSSISGQNTITVAKIKYWATQNEYFRFDRTVTRSNDPKQPNGMRERMIVTPEAYIKLTSASTHEPLTLDTWGTPERGKAFFGGRPFVCSAVRIDTLYSAVRLMQNLLEPRGSSPDVGRGHWSARSASLSEHGSRLTIQYTFTDPPYSTDGELICNPQSGVVVGSHCTYFGNGEKGELVITVNSKREYRFNEFDCVPAVQQEVTTQSDGFKETYECHLQDVDWTPVPLGVFSFEAQGITSLQPQGVWWRRLTVVSWGLLLFGVVFLVHWYRNRAAE